MERRPEGSEKHGMSRQVYRYSTDLTDAEWANLEGRVPAPLAGDDQRKRPGLPGTPTLSLCLALPGWPLRDSGALLFVLRASQRQMDAELISRSAAWKQCLDIDGFVVRQCKFPRYWPKGIRMEREVSQDIARVRRD